MPAKKTQLSKRFVSPDWGDVQAVIFFHSLCVSSFFLSRCFFQQHPECSWAHGSPVVRFYQWVNSTEVGQINTGILWETEPCACRNVCAYECLREQIDGLTGAPLCSHTVLRCSTCFTWLLKGFCLPSCLFATYFLCLLILHCGLC